MTRPTTTVEVAFDAGWTGTPTWTDVSSYTRHADGISTSHWRGDEDSEAGPSSLSFALNNLDGRFTPGNASGAHYPNVKKGRRVRVRSTVNGNTYDRGVFYVNDWSVDWPGKVSSFATCQVTASSRMARLGQTAELRSIIEEEIRRVGPVAHYPLGEPEGAPGAADSVGEGAGFLTVGTTGTVLFGTATGPGTDDLTAAKFTTAPGSRGLHGSLAASGITSIWMSAFVNWTVGAGLLNVGNWYNSTESAGLRLALFDASSLAQASLNIPGASSVGLSASLSPDGETHHLLATAISGGDAKLYLDGVEVDSDTCPAFSLTLEHLAIAEATDVSELVVAHLAVGTGTVSADQASAMAGSGVGFEGETPAERLERYAAFVGLTSSDLDLDTGQAQGLAHIDTTGKTALACMREVEVTESGVLFDALDGTLTFHDRAHRYASTSAFTLDYAAGQVANELRPVLDDQLMRNDLTATNANGISARVVDQDSIDNYGVYRETLDLATTDPEEPGHRATWVVDRYSEPLTRISSIEVQLESSAIGTALTEAILAAQVGTMFTVTNLPSNAPASSMRLFVEGMSETITAESHRITFRTSPAELFDVWILDDATYSILDSTTRLAY